jgi:CubicO group peptidase (beta-lactamase class C family)
MSVAVGLGGEIVWAEGFGWADVENQVPVREESKFRIGSVSKPLTAEAVGLLAEQGLLDLDSPVQRYVPTFPEKRWPITTRQVAGHLAGIRHYDGDEFLLAERYETVLDGLEIFQDDTLLFEPGERFSYSSYGWNLISAVIEGASGEDFLTYMRTHVFQPLGMRHTVEDDNYRIIPDRARFYHRSNDGRVYNAPYVDNSYKWAGGGFLSTPSDLVRFGFAHLGETLLTPEMIAELWLPQTTNDGESTGYGIGWATTLEEGEVIQAGHGGGSIGGTTGFQLWPGDGVVVAIVGNMSQAPTGGLIVSLIAGAFLSGETDGTGPDVAGEFECVATVASGESVSGRMSVARSTEGYWGRFEWSDDSVDRVVASPSDEGETRLITVDDDARLSELTFEARDAAGLHGSFRSGGATGGLECAAQ